MISSFAERTQCLCRVMWKIKPQEEMRGFFASIECDTVLLLGNCQDIRSYAS